MEFFDDFEEERRGATAALSDLRSMVMDLPAPEVDAEERLELPEITPDMLTYVNAFTREGATKENVGTRAEVMHTRLYQYLQANS